MIRNFNQFSRINENANELHVQMAKAALYRYMEGWKKIGDIDAQFDKFLASDKHGKNMQGGIFEQVWYFLVWNLFTKDLKTNGLIKELSDICNSTNLETFKNLTGNSNDLKKNLTKLVSDLFGHINAVVGALKKENYAEAAAKMQVVVDKYVNKSGFSATTSIFSDTSKPRLEGFLNTLNSPLAQSKSKTSSGATQPQGRRAATAGSVTVDRNKMSTGLKSLID